MNDYTIITDDQAYLECIQKLINMSHSAYDEACSYFDLIQDPEIKKQAEKLIESK